MAEINVNVNVNGGNGANRPLYQMKTNRGVLKTLLLTIVTLGIYPLILYSSMSTDINVIASPHDGKRTMHYCLLFFIVAPLTFGIGALVWQHRICNRIGDEARRRRIPTSFSAGSFWLWCILGSIIVIGPVVFLYKLLHTMNALCVDYNLNG